MEKQKLSSINPLHAFFLSEENITNYVFKPIRSEIEDNSQYKFGLVLGCSVYSILEKRIKNALLLYQKQTLDKFLLTGGIGYLSKNRNESEANIMRSILLKNNVPDSDIIIEDASKDTYQNIKNSVKIIEDNCTLIDKSLIITSDFHSKRAKGIIEKMTILDVHSHGVKDGICDIDVWNKNSSQIRKLIRTEALLLSWYVRRNIINDQTIEPIYIKTRK